MIFCCDIVPHLYSTAVITLVLKRGKPAGQYSSFRPITVSPVLCKVFELLAIDEVSDLCYTPDNQFGFKKEVGRNNAYHLIANLLLHAHENNEVFHFSGLDVSRSRYG
jgi:hypothetical protein